MNQTGCSRGIRFTNDYSAGQNTALRLVNPNQKMLVVAIDLPYTRNLNFDLVERAKGLLAKVGLDPDQDRRAFEMSGGEQQRVAIARALMNNPRVILADEPTGHLDESTSDGIIALIRDIHESMNTGVVLVTHNLKYLPVGNKIYALRNGVLSVQR